MSIEEIFLRSLLSRQDSQLTSFCIKDVKYSYSDLFNYVEQIYEQVKDIQEEIVYIYSFDDIRTYATILALWYSGHGYVALNPIQPLERHNEIIDGVGTHYIVSCIDGYDANVEGMQYIHTSQITHDNYSKKYNISVDIYSEEITAYLIFTSGSTGKPKGVQINRGNLAAFIVSMDQIGLDLTTEDRCLQPFDLSFDFSISGYVIPLHKGASVYTIPQKVSKFIYMAGLLGRHHLTFLQMVPSMARNLLPYIDEVDRSSIRYNMFGGDALTGNVLKAWPKDCPNMITYNVYGPTENTDICTSYKIYPDMVDNPLSHNDIICMGKAFGYTDAIILDDQDQIITSRNIEGELCLAGKQVTPGYWKNPEENTKKFININRRRFYRTGDMCFYGEDDNLMFTSRKDFQIKINGFRVETGEIENQYASISGGRFSVVMPYKDDNGNLSLSIIIEGDEYDYKQHRTELSKILPFYELPSKWLFVDSFPLNNNGKIDRKKLKEIFKL